MQPSPTLKVWPALVLHQDGSKPLKVEHLYHLPPRDKVVQEQLWGISVKIVKEFLSPEVLAKYGEPIASDPTELADQPPDPAVNQPMSGPPEHTVNQPAHNHVHSVVVSD